MPEKLLKPEKVAWHARVKDGTQDEYKRRHDEIWQSMREVLTGAGIVNYTVWEVNGELFGYYECLYGAEYAARVQAESPVVDEWNEYMKDILFMDFDPDTGVTPPLKKMFEFN